MKNKRFNIIISGVGGQGLITLTKVISEAALIEGFDVKTSELHGLSQRYGSVQTHIRFGKRVYSPLIPEASADLILGLEITETLRNIIYANSKTIVLTNKSQISYQGGLKDDLIVKKIKSLFKSKKYLLPASEICKKELGNEIASGIYLLGFAIKKKLIPLKSDSISKAILKVIPKRYLELNKKAFELGQKNND